MARKREQVNERLTLISDTEGLTFGTDAYLLSAWLHRIPRGRAVELGAGTGIISMLCLARDSFRSVVCIELQEEFCSIMRENAEINGFRERMEVLCADIRDIGADSPFSGCDAVFANPPYLRADGGFANGSSALDIARHERAGGILDFCACASRLLKYGGYFSVVFPTVRMAELFSAMSASGITPKRLTLIYPDTNRSPSLFLCEGRRGGHDGLFVTKPLFLFENGVESPEHKRIYEEGAFSEQYQKP